MSGRARRGGRGIRVIGHDSRLHVCKIRKLDDICASDRTNVMITLQKGKAYCTRHVFPMNFLSSFYFLCKNPIVDNLSHRKAHSRLPHLTSPGPDNARVDKLRNLISYRRILHVILQCLRVALRLLQNALHHWVVHDSLFLRSTSSAQPLQGEREK